MKTTIARATAAAFALLQAVVAVEGWSLFFNSDEQAPWRAAFETVDVDGDGYLVLTDLEPLLREHFRRTEQDNPHHEMILANEQMFEEQAAEVAGNFEKEGTRLVCFDLVPFLMVTCNCAAQTSARESAQPSRRIARTLM
jgi:hypothetical protein